MKKNEEQQSSCSPHSWNKIFQNSRLNSLHSRIWSASIYREMLLQPRQPAGIDIEPCSNVTAAATLYFFFWMASKDWRLHSFCLSFSHSSLNTVTKCRRLLPKKRNLCDHFLGNFTWRVMPTTHLPAHVIISALRTL